MSENQRPDVCEHGSLRRSCEVCDLAERLEAAEQRIAYLTSELDPEQENSLGPCGWCHNDVRDASVTTGEPPQPYHVECYGHLVTKQLAEARALLRAVIGVLETHTPGNDAIEAIEAFLARTEGKK